MPLPRRRRRSLGPLTIAALAAVVAGCGGPAPGHDAPGGSAVELGGVSYEVQVARELHPGSPGDRPLFAGVPPAARRLPGDRIWLGVFLQAENESGRPRRTARRIALTDSRHHAFRAVPLGLANGYAYAPVTLGPGDAEPDLSSPAASSPEQGSLVLFRVPVASLAAGLPLRLQVADHGRRRSVQLDL